MALSFENSHVNLKNANINFIFIEENDKSFSDEQIFYFGKLIGFGQSHLVQKYNLQERRYIGNTTMDPALSFIQANMVKANHGSLILDPFCGTGGLLIAAAHFGAAVMGTEINYQVARAVGKSSRMGQKFLTDDQSIAANFCQYSLNDRFMGVLLADASKHEIWHYNNFGFVDAILTDPPYGVREKIQKIGKKSRKDHYFGRRYPEKAKYEISSSFLDLLNLAARLLVVKGRLAFWFPSIERELVFTFFYFPNDLIYFNQSEAIQARNENQNNGVKNYKDFTRKQEIILILYQCLFSFSFFYSAKNRKFRILSCYLNMRG
ncbi:unnamed protein product [Dracunculus medinensis]|uniref:tRNA (guanine(10)-N(2))-methyltransferase TRMT11 n=1 Tax=Dracunculus medinensis TaxID=318479 RepID=A0A3P7Q9S5_DRAME|nr:unnamed protein product [Dracunculus medinensis]